MTARWVKRGAAWAVVAVVAYFAYGAYQAWQSPWDVPVPRPAIADVLPPMSQCKEDCK